MTKNVLFLAFLMKGGVYWPPHLLLQPFPISYIPIHLCPKLFTMVLMFCIILAYYPNVDPALFRA